DDPEVFFALGEVELELDKLEEAERSLQEAARLRPAHRETYKLLARLAQKLGKTADVIAAYEKVTQIEPEHLEGLLALARLYFSLERWKDAEKAAIEVLRKEDENTEMLVVRGTCLNEQQRADEAVPVLQKATRVAPDSAEASLQLAIA